MRIESSEDSGSRGEDMVDYESSEYEGSHDGDSGTHSGDSVRGTEGGKGKGIVISDGSSAAKKQAGTPEKGSKGGKRRRLQSCSVDGSPSLATAGRIGRIQFPRGVEWRIPLPAERPWSPPEGFMCLHESYFGWAHMFFPLPRALIEFCARKRVAISQLSAVAMIDFLGLIVFGAECDVVVDASFLEKKMRLISNWKSPGTFQTQAGVVRGKPGRINDWQLNYFFVKINEESVGGAGSMIVKEWNRELGKSFHSFYRGGIWVVVLLVNRVFVFAGTKGKKDRCAKGGDEPYERDLKRIEGLRDREYELFTGERVERQIRKICGQCGGSGSSSLGAGGSKNVPLTGGVTRKVEKRGLTIEEGRGWRRVDSDDEPLVRKRKKVDLTRKEKARVEGHEAAMATSGAVVDKSSKAPADNKRASALVVVEQGTRKRKEKEREKEGKKGDDVEIVDVLKIGDGGGSGAGALVEKRTGAGGSTTARGLTSSLSKREGKRVQTGEGRSHKFKFDYEGEGPIMLDPQSCGSFFQRIPEAVDEYVGGNVDLDATYDEFAGLVFQLANVKNRFVRGHENVVMEAKKEVTAREVEVAKLKEENDALRTLEKDVEDERKRRIFQEEENGRLRFELEKRVEEMERLRRDSLTVESLRNNVTSLEAAVADRDKEIIAVDRGCRMVLKRLLREQADALYARYLEKNEAACDGLDRYLREREAREEVEGKLDQADGVIEVLEALKTDKVVEVPDSTFLKLRAKKDGYEKELQELEVVEFSSENLRLGLPDSVGSVDIEGIDFKAELMVAEEGVSREREEVEMRSQPVEGGGRSASDGGSFIDVEN